MTWTLDPPRPATLRRALPFALLVAFVAIFDLNFHEFWRDEAGAMLEAQAVPWSGLLDAMHLEGVPPLFHALLKIAATVLPGPLGLVTVGAIGLSVLYFGTYRLLVAISGSRSRSAAVTLAFAVTYAYGYELGVMIRQYTLGLGLGLLSLAHFRDALATGDRRSIRWGALAAGLCTLTSAHAACVSGAGLLAFGLLCLAQRRSLRAWWPILLTLPCFALVAYLAQPFPGRVADANVVYKHDAATTIRLGLQAVVSGVLPGDFWLVETFAPRLARVFAALRAMSLWGLVTAAALALAWRSRLLWRRWRVEAFDLLVVAASLPPLLVIIVNHYWGFYRHHLFLAVPALVILAGWCNATSQMARWRLALRSTGWVLMVPWFIHGAMLGVGCFIIDYRYPFSETKAAAQVMPRDAHVVADAEWRSIAMLLWRPDLVLRSSSWMGKRVLYTAANTEWHRMAPVAPIVAEECRAAPDRVRFSGVRESLGKLTRCATPVPFPRSPLAALPFTWETIEVFAIDCGCVAAQTVK